ncbi:glycerophosphodiester phosphodiesterase family protein [Geminicoccus harenae]|uniref:glycerophosphodiester phosphodiesterase family protein n=1 Tax=Geminicoccus harenae TaxID=2498453 RepID=UPI001C96B3AF|nr:glycerophosphodiester phosphodiesterase family protein [Geminicoccus harenae]
MQAKSDYLPFGTLDGQIPIVVGHRGASGYRPEHTLESYQTAIEMGADLIEPDVVATSDGHLIARHENLLAGVQLNPDGSILFDAEGRPVVTEATNNVAEYDGNGDGEPEFYDRLTVKTIDGRQVGGWFSEDFTLDEIKQLGARERIGEIRPGSAAYDDQFEIPTFREVVELAQQASTETGRPIGVYVETKHPTYFALEGTHQNEDKNGNGVLDAGEDINANGSLDVVNGGGKIGISLGQAVVDTLVEAGFTHPEQVYIQSFEVANLIELQNEIMPKAGVDLPLVQLMSGTGSQAYDIAYNFLSGDPAADPSVYDGFLIGVSGATTYGDLATADGLKSIAAYAEGVGPTTSLILPTEALATPIDADGDGIAETGSKLTGQVTDFIRLAHDAGMQVHPYTLRAEPVFLPADAEGNAQSMADFARLFIKAGADGFFTDNPDIGRAVVDGITSGYPFLQLNEEQPFLPAEALGIQGDLFDLSAQDGPITVEVDLLEQVGKLDNVLGAYTYDADGTITGVDVLFAHAGTGDTEASVRVEEDENLGFFLISDGAALNEGLDGGELRFVRGGSEEAGSIHDGTELALMLEQPDGSLEAVLGEVFHSVDADPDAPGNALNPGGGTQVVSGFYQGRTALGFEDLNVASGRADGDYNDLVVSVRSVAVEPG